MTARIQIGRWLAIARTLDAPIVFLALVSFFAITAISFLEASTSNCGRAHSEFPVHEAAKYGAVEEILCFIATGKDINELDALGFTPLGVAAAFGRIDVVTALTTSADLDAGKTPPIHAAMLSSSDSLVHDERREREVVLASFYKRIGVMRTLIDSGADVEVPGVAGEGFLSSLIFFGCFENRAITSSETESVRAFLSLTKAVVDAHSHADDQHFLGLTALLDYPDAEVFDRKCLADAIEVVLLKE